MTKYLKILSFIRFTMTFIYCVLKIGHKQVINNETLLYFLLFFSNITKIIDYPFRAGYRKHLF